jgi:hypothetical protein
MQPVLEAIAVDYWVPNRLRMVAECDIIFDTMTSPKAM